jgi:hypothetical protein
VESEAPGVTRIRIEWTLAVALAVGFAPAALADVEGELRAELVGRFALTRDALLSECTQSFTNVEIVGGRPSGGKGVRFEAGELVRIENVKVGALTGLDVYLSLSVPYLLSFPDGPFTLYEERGCRVQLEFDVERDVRRDRTRALAAIAAAVELFESEEAARRAGWNGREREAFPADWEETRRAHAVWKVEERKRAVREKTDEVLAVAAHTLSSMSSGEGYLASFGAGARARGDSWSSCEEMLSSSFYVSGSGEDDSGWAAGQRVAWATRLARELQKCYLVPE